MDEPRQGAQGTQGTRASRGRFFMSKMTEEVRCLLRLLEHRDKTIGEFREALEVAHRPLGAEHAPADCETCRLLDRSDLNT